MRTGIILSWCALAVQRLTVVAVGNAPGIVPYAEDQQLIMKVNVNFLSDQPEQYVAGQLTVLGHGARVPGGQLQFEIVRWPKYGQIGWNNSVSGEFVYSPRELSIDTSNHGVEALVPVPGCKYGCGSCPNAAGAHLGPSQPVPDPNATEVCNGRSTRCNGYRSTLRDPDFPGIERYVPLASREQEGWVNGYTCPEAPEQDQLLYRKAKSDNRLEMMDQDVRQRVECKSVPARGCVMHSATVPRDTFSFHVRNQFGVSNIATVTVEFDHNDQADMTLEFTFLTGFLMMLATCTGLLRIIVLQTLLHPYREYNWIPAAFSNAFCPVPEPAFKRPRDPSDYKPEFMKELALAWPPPGYHERRDAAAASRRPTQQLIPDVPHRSPIATRSKSRREAQIEKVDNALRRSLSRLVATASSGGQEAGSSTKSRRKVHVPGLTKINKRDGADEKDFDSESFPQGGSTTAASTTANAANADGEARIAAAMDMLTPSPCQGSAQDASMAGVSMIGEVAEQNRDSVNDFDDFDDFDDLDKLDALEIENPVASAGHNTHIIGDEV